MGRRDRQHREAGGAVGMCSNAQPTPFPSLCGAAPLHQQAARASEWLLGPTSFSLHIREWLARADSSRRLVPAACFGGRLRHNL